MTLTTCPDCKQRVFNQALTCPNCGYPLAQAQAPDLARILCAGPWMAQSGTLVDAQLVATFSPDHRFSGETRPDPARVTGMQLVAHARFQGRWQVAGSQPFIAFPLTMMGNTTQTDVAIQFTGISENALSGVDKFVRSWEWRRIEGAPLAPTMENIKEYFAKQASLSQMYSTLAKIRHEKLKQAAERFAKEEESGKAKPPKLQRRSKNDSKPRKSK